MRWGGLEAVLLTLICASALPARAGLIVESYTATAETNAYAPFSQAQYFTRQDVENTSPAAAQVSGDWTGTNPGGSTPTWHWVGSSHASMTTNFGSSSASITGDGAFSFSLTTTAGFVDQSASNGVYSPGGAADYNFLFNIDAPATYFVSVLMAGSVVVGLGSFDGTDVFDEFHASTTPATFQQMGTITPGRYQLRAATGLGVGNLSNGINNYSASGSFSNYSFTLQTPEPATGLPALVLFSAITVCRRRGDLNRTDLRG